MEYEKYNFDIQITITHKTKKAKLLIRENQFNSGVIVFRPNQTIFLNLIQFKFKLSLQGFS